MGKNDGKQWLTDETVQAFQSAIKDDDFGPLSRIFDDTKCMDIRRELGMKHGIGMPPEEMIKDAMMVIDRYRTMYGDDH